MRAQKDRKHYFSRVFAFIFDCQPVKMFPHRRAGRRGSVPANTPSAKLPAKDKDSAFSNKDRCFGIVQFGRLHVKSFIIGIIIGIILWFIVSSVMPSKRTYQYQESSSPPQQIPPHKFGNIVILSMLTRDPLHFKSWWRWPWEWTSKEGAKRKYQIISGNKQKYANKWGFEFREEHHIENKEAVLKMDHEIKRGKRHPQWHKPWAIRSVFQEYNQANKPLDYVLWIDADAAFMDCTVSLSDFIENLVDSHYFEMTGLQSSGDIIFTGEPNGIVNNGVFLMKNSEWSMDFLDQWIFTRENSHYDRFFTNKNYGDQSIFQSMICGFKPRDLDIPGLWKAYHQSKENKGDDWKTIAKLMGNPDIVPTEIAQHVMKLPQDLLNSYDYWSGERFVVHCTSINKGLSECRNFDSLIERQSNC